MSDLSSNETLDPLENTTSNDAHDANVVDNTPEDWESIIDFEMKMVTPAGYCIHSTVVPAIVPKYFLPPTRPRHQA